MTFRLDDGRPALIAAVCVLIAVACSSDNRTAGIDRGGARTPVAASGPITGFGSIFVNGVRFDIGSAQIDVNGVTGTEADLRIGQIVSVVGEVDDAGTDGVAMRVYYESNVTGPVTSVDPTAGTFFVLGQTVVADEARFELGSRPAALGSLAPGDVVEVSGFVSGNGSIVASFVELEDSSDLRVRGTVESLDSAALTFRINALTVDFSAAGQIEGFPSGTPADGDVVVVIGSSLDSAGALTADRVSRYEAVSAEGGEEIEIEDLITRFVSADDFDVGGIPVRIVADTDFEGGTVADLQLNVKVQVEGVFVATGAIQAEKIEIKDGGRIYGD